MTKMPPTPELDRQSEIIKSGKAGQIQDFYDWIRGEGWEISEPVVGSRLGYCLPVALQPEQMMADFFEIDLNKIETERRALLEAIREGYRDE